MIAVVGAVEFNRGAEEFPGASVRNYCLEPSDRPLFLMTGHSTCSARLPQQIIHCRCQRDYV